MGLNWEQLTAERNVWVRHNFPDPDNKRTPLDSVLGCIEELGELTHHHLKQAQAIRGDVDFHEKETRDAIGDITVYLLGVMSFYKVLPLEEDLARGAIPYDSTDEIILALADTVGALAAEELANPQRQQKYTVTNIVTAIVRMLQSYCLWREWDYDETVQSTWDHVKQRDWIKYPGTGLPPSPGSKDNPIKVEVEQPWS